MVYILTGVISRSKRYFPVRNKFNTNTSRKPNDINVARFNDLTGLI